MKIIVRLTRTSKHFSHSGVESASVQLTPVWPDHPAHPNNIVWPDPHCRPQGLIELGFVDAAYKDMVPGEYELELVPVRR